MANSAIIMPDLGSGTTEGTLVNWLKQVGDTIKLGDVIAEVESDKATIEVPANVAGTITQLIGNPGDTLQVGGVIGYVGEASEVSSGKGTAAAAAAPASAPAASAPQPVAAVSTATKPIETAANGSSNGTGSELEGAPGGVKASPVARRLASEKGIDLRQVKGSGPGGRIVKEDVETFKPSTALAAASAVSAPGVGAPNYGTPPTEDVEVIEVTRLRQTIARRMVESKQQFPHFYVTTQVDVTALLELRKQLNATLDEDSKISVNDLVVKATAISLKKFPNLNSHFYGDKIIRHKRINIGIAVALPDGGLMNVVAKDADKTALGTLALQNKEMIARARDRKVRPDDVQGSTFTVSNLGAYDVEHFAAIINPPEAGILAVGSAQKVPIVKEDGSIGVGNRMRVTVSVDHRVSDGAEAAQFLQWFKKVIENPMALLI